MEEFKIYSITDKYVGTVLEMHGYKYFVPMSSPKEIMYKQKLVNDQSAGYVKSALDFVKLEELCRDYMSPKAES